LVVDQPTYGRTDAEPSRLDLVGRRGLSWLSTGNEKRSFTIHRALHNDGHKTVDKCMSCRSCTRIMSLRAARWCLSGGRRARRNRLFVDNRLARLASQSTRISSSLHRLSILLLDISDRRPPQPSSHPSSALTSPFASPHRHHA
jgi:hypothetical protein